MGIKKTLGTVSLIGLMCFGIKSCIEENFITHEKVLYSGQTSFGSTIVTEKHSGFFGHERDDLEKRVYITDPKNKIMKIQLPDRNGPYNFRLTDTLVLNGNTDPMIEDENGEYINVYNIRFNIPPKNQRLKLAMMDYYDGWAEIRGIKTYMIKANGEFLTEGMEVGSDHLKSDPISILSQSYSPIYQKVIQEVEDSLKIKISS